MTSSQKPRTWTLRAIDEQAVRDLGRARDVSEVVARLLVSRGFADPEAAAAHLTPNLHALHDPGLLPDMGAACARLARALKDEELILVHGDYDVDGVTGTSLLVRLFQKLGGRVAWHIPNRFTDGYAFGQHSIDRARELGASVVVSVDNGTSSLETITALAELGIDTIVTDHHEPPRGDLPPAVAIVNPKLDGSQYPFRELCGGAVAFKLAWGLCQELSGGGRVRPELRDFLVDAMAYVAIATVCDVVPLIDENRVLARYGLRSLAGTQHPGMRALLRVAGIDREPLLSDDVGFQIGPRLNAAGRLGTAQTAVDLLMCEDEAQAQALAVELDSKNVERKEIERGLLVEALAQAERFADAARYPVMIVAGEGWHQGVIGIVAARLVDRYRRPAIVIGMNGARGRGSARSVAGVSVLELMHAGAKHMVQYGGHAQAAGLELESGSENDLREAICAAARETFADGMPDQPLTIDGDLELGDLTPAMMREIDRLEPFGECNEAPVLLSRDVRLERPPRVCGEGGRHLMLHLRRGPAVMKAMAFSMGARAEELRMGEPIHVVHTPRWNTFRGETNLELLLHDFRSGETCDVETSPA